MSGIVLINPLFCTAAPSGIIPLAVQTLQSLLNSLSLTATSWLWPASPLTICVRSPLLRFLILSGHNGLPIILPTSQSQSAWGSLQLLSPSLRNTHTQISAWSSSHFLQIFIPKPPSQEHLPCLPCLNLHNSPQHFQPPCQLHVSLELFARVLYIFFYLFSISLLEYKFHDRRDFVCFVHCHGPSA